MASVVFSQASRIYPGTTKPAVDKLDLTVNDFEVAKEVSEELKNTLNTIKKVNFLALKITEGNKDLYASEFDKYIPTGGDVIMISKIINRYQNRVKLSGAAYRPDTYELTQGMRVSDLIKKGDGLKEDAFTSGAQLFRVKPNLLREVVNIDLGKALAGDKSENIWQSPGHVVKPTTGAKVENRRESREQA